MSMARPQICISVSKCGVNEGSPNTRDPMAGSHGGRRRGFLPFWQQKAPGSSPHVHPLARFFSLTRHIGDIKKQEQ